MLSFYEPKEDSFLLAEQVKKYAKGHCLDMGTGSGVQALAAEKKADKILAVDIDKKAIDFCKKNIKNKKIRFIYSNLFKNIKSKFDTITFNPPYLPELKRESKQLARKISGGKKGHELLEKFLDQASNYLKPNGKILIVFSSLTNKQKVDEIIKNNLLESETVATKKLFFETLYVYLIQKSKILKEMEKKVSKVQFLTKGHRGLIFTARYNNKKVIIKLQRKDIAATETVKREAKFLRLLNKHNIGPKLIFAKSQKPEVFGNLKKSKTFSSDDYFIAEFVKGKIIKNCKKTKNLLKNVLNQCFSLDKLKINKEEMHNPYKHILINKKITLIDFERAHYNPKVKNVTQFCQYILSSSAVKDRNRLIKLSKEYKTNPTRQNLNKIIKELK